MPEKGDRIELTYCSDPHTRLEPGDQGTVSMVDGTGTVHVKWDNGSSLGLIPGEDDWVPLNREGNGQEEDVPGASS